MTQRELLHDLPEQLLQLLQHAADDIVTQRLQLEPTDDSFDPASTLASAAPLFAALHAVNRNTLQFARDCKASTQEARLGMDSAHLRLQNLMYERNHLEREIRKCEEYESQYQSLPMLPVEEFVALYDLEEPLPGLTLPKPDTAHDLMLARLQFELAERQRFDEEKKELSSQKAQLVKANEVKKRALEDLEKQVDDFVAAAKSIQSKMHGPGAEADTTALPAATSAPETAVARPAESN